MPSENDTIISSQTVINSTRLVNIHAIDERVYYIYVDSVSVSGCEIWRFKSRIVSSCICGQTIALVLESGVLVVFHSETIRDPEFNKISEETFGMTSNNLLRRQVVATRSGRFLAVNVSRTSILIYEFDGSKLSFVRTLNVSLCGSFQLTGGDNPYLWHLSKGPECHFIELFEVGEFSPVMYPDEPIARLPVSPPQINPSSHNSHVFLHSCDTESLDGILAYMNGSILYLSLKRAIIGDVISGVIWLPSTWFASISTSKVGLESKVYICNQTNGKIVQIKSQKHLNELHPVFSETIGTLRYEMRLQSWCHIAVVSVQRETLIDSSEHLEVEKEAEIQIISEAPEAGRIRNFDIDPRKRPWRSLVLNGSSLEARATAVPVKYTSNKLEAINVSRVAYVPTLSMLILSVVGSRKLRCFIGDRNQTTLVDRWNNPKTQKVSIEFESLLCAHAIGNHTLVLAGSEGVQFRTAFAPFKELAYIKPEPQYTIIDANFGDRFGVLQCIDSVLLISLESGFRSFTLIKDLPITFARLQQSQLYVGINIFLWQDKQRVKNLFSGRQTQTFFDDFPYSINENTASGVVLHYKETEGNFLLERIDYHRYVPTVYYVSPTYDTDIAIYGFNGYVGQRTHGKAVRTTFTDTKSPLQYSGVLEGDRILLIGLGIFIASPYGCEQLIEASGKIKDYIISSAASIDHDIIAYISKNELKFVAASDFIGPHAPTILRTKVTPVLPKRVELSLLLVPSQRLVILHGENICMFYDSVTFEQILVTGITAAWCDSMALWKFISNGETFEHLLVSNGRGLLESYSFYRDGPSLQCTCKYRATVAQQFSSQRLKEILHCRDNAIYMGRNNELLMAVPLPKHVTYRQTLKYEIRHISHAGSFLVVSSKKDILIFSCENLAHIVTLSIPDNILHSVDHDSDMEAEAEEAKSTDMEIVMHVAADVRNGNGIDNSIYILCVVHSSNMRRYKSLLATFEPKTQTLSLANYRWTTNDEWKIKSVKPDPRSNPDASHSALRAYGVTTDYRTVFISITPSGVQVDLKRLF